jgi:hypothetical protein
LWEHGLDKERVHVILNFVDLERFKPRPPLPHHPARIVFSNGRAIPRICGRKRGLRARALIRRTQTTGQISGRQQMLVVTISSREVLR